VGRTISARRIARLESAAASRISVTATAADRRLTAEAKAAAGAMLGDPAALALGKRLSLGMSERGDRGRDWARSDPEGRAILDELTARVAACGEAA
jgi:hypothetical protein